MGKIDFVNRANLKRLSEKELRELENSEYVSSRMKKQAFVVLTNRNLTSVKVERRGTSHKPKKNREV